MASTGLLRGPIIGTLMSNLGLERYLTDKSIQFARAKVGDRYIHEMLKAQNGNLGGEPSGHILLPDQSRSGDGLIAALQVLALLVRRGQKASEALSLFQAVPQKLENLKDVDKALLEDAKIQKLVSEIEADFDGEGRVLLRPSGTEPVMRVMVEALDEARLDKAMSKLCDALLAG